MPIVTIDLSELAGVAPGLEHVDGATVAFAPHRAYGVDETWVTRNRLVVDVATGVTTVVLPATPVGNAFEVHERGWSGARDGFVVVPDVPGPIAYTSLVWVDESTLAPDVEPEAAWWAQVDALLQSTEDVREETAASRDQAAGSAGAAAGSATSAAGSASSAAVSATAAQTARAGAESARDAAAGSATTAGQSATLAGQERATAQTARTGAETARTGAETAQTGAQTARTAAEAAQAAATAATFGGTPLGDVSLDTLTTPGIYRQSTSTFATLANSYPAAPNGGAWTITVLSSNGPGAGSGLSQKAVRTWSSDAGRVEYIRTKGTSAGAWSAWSRFFTTRAAAPASGPGAEIFMYEDVANVERQIPTLNNTLGTAHLDTITAAGTWSQGTGSNVTQANGYPVTSNNPVILEVIPMGSWIEQRLTFISSAAISARGHWVRVKTSAWQPWQYVSPQRTDKTAGIAIYTWDEVAQREQLIYGDTGWRDISGLLVNGWTATTLTLRRTTYSTEVRATGLNPAAATSSTPFTLPSGFASWNSVADAVVLAWVTAAKTWRVSMGSSVAIAGWATTDPAVSLTAKFDTTSAWPTVNPGTLVQSPPAA